MSAHASPRYIALALSGILAALLLTEARAFDELNEAQALLYDRAHLANTRTDDTIRYRYVSGSTVDEATLTITGEADDERRDVTVSFLSDERALTLPDFKAYRGNPIVITMLEHLAQVLSEQAGGGTLYLRNRIRDGMAHDDIDISTTSVGWNNETIESTAVTFVPFRDDPFLGSKPGFGNAKFTLVFSDDVPGGVLSIGAELDGNAGFDYSLTVVEPDR